MKKPELLIPAGNLEKLKVACMYGADAVFLGGYEFGLRSSSDNFSLEDIKEGVEFANQYGVKIYVTTNIYAHEENIKGFKEFVQEIEKIGVTGIIVSDPAYIYIAQEFAPKLEIHISTQQSITNSEAVNFFEKIGADRVVLARELTIEEIKKIKQNTNIELEIFIHGAVCSSFSGRCTLSNHLTMRDSNRGGCCQSCRWNFELTNKNKSFGEDFSMSAKDMNVLNYLPEILKLNVDSLKVEGRMKSLNYVATVTKIYRVAIDSYFNDKKNFIVKQEWIDELKKAESRETYIGALKGDFSEKDQIFNEQYQEKEYDFCGYVIKTEEDNIIIRQKNYFDINDELEFFNPKGENITIKNFELFNIDNESITKANHPEMIVKIPANINVDIYTIIRKKNQKML